jgi:hypothetical protein
LSRAYYPPSAFCSASTFCDPVSLLRRVVFVIIPPMIINAEKCGREFEHAQWTGVGLQELRREEGLKAAKWNDLSEIERYKTWARSVFVVPRTLPGDSG